MSVTLGHNQYGKAETRVVRVYRDSDPHEIVDDNVSVALSGDSADIHLTGDNANCLTTDATKNTVNAFAKEHGEAARQPESFGYLQERYTTLQPTHDRVMATSVTGQWWHNQTDVDWGKSYDSALATMSGVFAGHHSLALQQTMYAMGEAMIDQQPEIGEVRFSLPNKHHFVVDLRPFGLDNPNEVFHADDRPYGFIEGTVHNDDAPSPGLAFDPGQGWS